MFIRPLQTHRSLYRLLSLRAQNSDVLDANTSVVAKCPTHLELAIVICELDVASGSLLDAVSIIKVQHTLRLIRPIWRNPQHKILLAQLRSRIGRFSAKR
jgi:hypothetical protein